MKKRQILALALAAAMAAAAVVRRPGRTVPVRQGIQILQAVQGKNQKTELWN